MKRRTVPRLCGAAVCAVGIGLMLFGAFRGEMNVVFQKAVKICLECIGIG